MIMDVGVNIRHLQEHESILNDDEKIESLVQNKRERLER